MIYPKFLTKGSTIGICAPSAGVGKKLEKYINSINVLKANGYKIKETENVRVNNIRSTTAIRRGQEFNSLVKDKDVDMIMLATGGEYMIETLPFIDFESIKENPKWLMGYSDPTNVTFPVTTMYDIATLYGFNGSSYENVSYYFQKDNLEILKGHLVKQRSSKRYQIREDYVNDILKFRGITKWIAKDNINLQGRLLGGCFEVISCLLGTKYDHTKEFIERHKKEGIVWFFDVYGMNPDDFYLRLLQMKYAGYFEHCNGVLVGRVGIPQEPSWTQMTYHKALKMVLKKVPCIEDMDIGHSSPMMTLINGAMVEVEYHDNMGSLKMSLK